MADPLQSLFDAVRAACSQATWSRGVELTRARAVTGERADDEEAVLRVATHGMLSRTVRLFLDDDDWECNCGGAEDACEHVAGAVIAWRRALEQGQELPGSAHVGSVEHRFSRKDGTLALTRYIVAGDEEHPLVSTLAALAEGRVDGPSFSASQADLSVELILGSHRFGGLPSALVPKLFEPMARCHRVFLDGDPVQVSADPVLPHARVEDQGDGFRVTLIESPEIDETFANGAALCGDTLRPTARPALSGREMHELSGGRSFGTGDVAELVTRVLPGLAERLPIDLLTERLPEAERIPPRLQIETRSEGETLIAVGSIVYGDPPRARLEGDRLVHLEGRVPIRDIEAERRLSRRLQTRLQLVPGIRAELTGPEAVAFAQRLEAAGESIQGKGHREFRLAPPLDARTSLDGSRWDVIFESSVGAGRTGRADSGRVLAAWRAGESLVPLLSGGWAPLPADWLDRHGHRIADLLEARREDGTLPRSVIPDLVEVQSDLDEPVPAEFGELRRQLADYSGLPRATLPDDLDAELRDYQQSGVDWLFFMKKAGLGALLADDMGLGKTLQALCAIGGRTLVVAPTSVLYNWREEIARFRPALCTSTFHGPRRELDPKADVTLTTYAILRLDADRLAAVNWDVVVLDEAQAIKNPQSRVAAAAFRLQADFRLTLTGTPVENRLDELWSQFHFLNRGLLGGRSGFQQRYATPIGSGDTEAAARLRSRIRPFVLRRLKREVAAELPPRTETVLRCELNPEERHTYDAIRAATLKNVVARLRQGGGVMEALEALLRLRQAACHRALIPGQEAASSSKVELLVDALGNVVAEGHRALIFSQWTSLLDLVEPALREAGIGFVRLDGATRDRAAVVRAFQAEDGPPAMLISLKAGGTGLNLTAADHVFLLDLWWNPAIEDQAADRAHRIGQHRAVMVYRLVAQETVEERILELQSAKRALADAVLGDADRAASLGRDDLLRLLE